MPTEDPVGMVDFGNRVVELTAQTTQIKTIEDEDTNVLAQDLGKKLSRLKKEIDETRLELNRPLNDAIKANNAISKSMFEPMDKEIERLRVGITSFEQEKERKRQEELAKANKEKEDAEKLQQAEESRVARIRGSIQKMDEDLTSKIKSVHTVDGLYGLVEKLENWTPKEEYYQEFTEEVMGLVGNLSQMIEERLPLVDKLQAAIEGGNQAEIDAAMQTLGLVSQKQQETKQEQKSEEESDDFKYRQQLIALFSSMGVDNVADNVTRVIEVYGSAKLAMSKKDEMIAAYQRQAEAQEKTENISQEKMKNQRIEFSFNVLDKSAVPLQYMKVDEVAIRAAIKANGQLLAKDMDSFTIEGVKITKELKTVFR